MHNRFSRWQPWLGFLIGMIFDLLVALLLCIKFQVNWPFGPGEEAQNRFSRWPLSGSLDFRLERFKLFFIYKLPLPSFESIGLGLGEQAQNRFSSGSHGGHLGFPTGTILVILIYKLLHTKFKVSWPTVVVGVVFLTLKAPRKTASENVICLCRLLNILADFSNLFLHTGNQCGSRSDC